MGTHLSDLHGGVSDLLGDLILPSGQSVGLVQPLFVPGCPGRVQLSPGQHQVLRTNQRQC